MDISRRALIVSPEPPKKHKKKKKSKNSDLDLTVAGDLVNGILTPESSSPSPKKRRKRSRGDSLTETLTQEESGSPRVGEATESLPSPSKKKHMNSESSNLLSPARKLLQSPTKKNQKDSESNNLQSTTMESLSSPTKKKRKGSQSSSEQSPTEESFSSPTKKTQKDSESSNLSTKHKKTSKRKASENAEEEVSGNGKKEKDVKGLEIPKDVEKLQAKYEAKLPEPHIPCTKFPIAPRKKLQSNWNKVFKKLDHPDPGSLFRPRKKAKEAAEEYLKENKIYKKLFKGINVDPVTIYKVMMKHIREFDLEKCLDELFDDNESCKEAVRPLIQERLDNLENVGGVDFTPKNILTMAEIRFMIPVVRQLLSTGNSLKTKDTWLKLVLLFPARSIHVLKSAWFGTAQWMVNAAMEDCKPFSYQERLTLINSVEKEGCEEEDLKWKTINKSFTGRSSKDLRYFWKCLKHHCPLTKTEDTTANILLHLHNTLVPKMKAEVERKMKSGAALLKKLNFHKKRVERYQKQLEAAQERLATSQNVLQQVQRSVDSYEMVISLEEKQDNEVEPSSESQE